MQERIVCEKRTYSSWVQTHEHAYGQLLFPLEGSLHIDINNQESIVREESYFYIPPQWKHTYFSPSYNEFLALDIPPGYLPPSYDAVTYEWLDEKWKALRFLLLEEIRQDNRTITELTKYILAQLQTAPSPSLQYIHEHFREKIPVEKLAQLEHYHPSHYIEWFRRRTGTTPYAYITGLRVEEARRLLTWSPYSATTIAVELGFENLSSFSRWFTANAGVSPRQFRRSLTIDKDHPTNR
ncbi:AraC family transcriptional regulator [Alkalicoccus luteus]|uniref:Helix-turn-helix transcriptional regulator n=1 Tax=Alkalicoccus luteus TaxID=1237094 RepID=A0A969TYI9_9BACI|nr:AraC family transcriptional regulator [Alkalicoccus luteus]NJP39219.1 helix-turn-helix transcriptional regulator [Alkalicoccus luteus]